MNDNEAYLDFVKRLTLLIEKNPHLIKTTLSNVFTMRIIGNKTHGDLAEIAIPEFINQFMYDFTSTHVGKELFRSKEHEEDIKITNDILNVEFAISLKAYGDGPLQLSTDKNFRMFPSLNQYGSEIVDGSIIQSILSDNAFSEFGNFKVLPLIYNEKKKKCNILVYDFDKAKKSIQRILYERPEGQRKHPVYRFYDANGGYICEVRYGDAKANALQRGLWTHTKNATDYFNSITGGWIDYSDNQILVSLFSHALLSTVTGHQRALNELKIDIEDQKIQSALK